MSRSRSSPVQQRCPVRLRGERGSASLQLAVLLPVLFGVMFLGLQAALIYHARTVAIAATSGISAVVAPDGSVVRSSELFTPAVFVEEIAQRANVSKPVVYEHFGGKEGLYAVVVDREMSALLDGITSSLTRMTNNRSRLRIERVALALLTGALCLAVKTRPVPR